jgi:protein-S-isoprenylcysteine O-methyltransferase Ste14
MPMSRKEQPELVTSGPYVFIRHPIYTGLILAMLGSALGVNIFWALMLIPVGAYFILSAGREETVICGYSWSSTPLIWHEQGC